MSSPDSQHPTEVAAIELAKQTWFFVGGQYVQDGDSQVRVGAAYVECYEPRKITHETPIVMIHGGVQTGTNFVATADGRRGWLHDFLRAGYVVYIMEQPERGRSGHALSGAQTQAMQRYGTERVMERFTAPRTQMLWPQASKHTQWPGTGQPGDPTFDNFFASQVEMLNDRSAIEELNRDAGTALLDRIGPAIVLTHSQSGPFGWLIANQRPELVKAILALEPNGPPFFEVEFLGEPNWFQYADTLDRPFGITRAELTFDPPLAPGETLTHTRSQAPSPDQVAGFLQAEPARTLPKLIGIPILIAVAEASYHAAYDHATSDFLSQAGVEHDFVQLADHGLRGNGHMVMLECNSHAAADLFLQWLARHQL